MWFWLVATVKTNATPVAINAKRQEWLAQGKERQLVGRCRSAQRYVVEQHAPLQVLWLLETDDRDAVNILTDHFGDLWDIRVSEVKPQAIG